MFVRARDKSNEYTRVSKVNAAYDNSLERLFTCSCLLCVRAAPCAHPPLPPQTVISVRRLSASALSLDSRSLRTFHELAARRWASAGSRLCPPVERGGGGEGGCGALSPPPLFPLVCPPRAAYSRAHQPTHPFFTAAIPIYHSAPSWQHRGSSARQGLSLPLHLHLSIGRAGPSANCSHVHRKRAPKADSTIHEPPTHIALLHRGSSSPLTRARPPPRRWGLAHCLRGCPRPDTPRSTVTEYVSSTSGTADPT